MGKKLNHITETVGKKINCILRDRVYQIINLTKLIIRSARLNVGYHLLKRMHILLFIIDANEHPINLKKEMYQILIGTLLLQPIRMGVSLLQTEDNAVH